MNCHESHLFLQQRLDGEPIGTALDSHLAACAECAALHAAAQRLQQGLRLLSVPLAPAGLRDRIVAQAVADHRAHKRRRWVMAAVPAIAASLVAAALGIYYGSRPTEITSPTDSGQMLTAISMPSPTAPSLRDQVAEASSAVFSLTRRQADETVSQTRRLWPAVTPQLLDEPPILSEPLEPPARSLREAGQNVSAGLEPVTNSARRAVGMFLRELPMGGDDKPGF